MRSSTGKSAGWALVAHPFFFFFFPGQQVCITKGSRSKFTATKILPIVVHKNVEYCSWCHGWNPTGAGNPKSVSPARVVQATKLGWPFWNTTFCTFSKGLKPVFKCPMFSAESVCLSHFGRFVCLFLNVLDLKIKFLTSFLSPHLKNFPKDVF